MKSPRHINPIPIVIVVVLVLVVAIQLYASYSCHDCSCKGQQEANFISPQTAINDTVFSTETSRNVHYWLFRNCEGGFVFGDEDIDSTEQKVIDFIIFEETIALKRKNEIIMRFINLDDTLTIQFTKLSRHGNLIEPRELKK